MIPGKPFDPATLTSRRPTPEKFAHLKKWIEPIVRNIPLTSITEITNINQQLEHSATLFISNIINRVIAQIAGKYGEGFVTIEGTEAGALHVSVQDIAAAATQPSSVADGENVVLGALADAIVAAGAAGSLSAKLRRVTQGLEDLKTGIEAKNAGTSKTMITAAIDDSDGGNVLTIVANATKKHKITTIVLTVGGDTDIAIFRGATPLSGPLQFGGTDEPRGMVANHGNYPLETAANEAFNITSSAAVQVSGYVIYYTEA